MKARVEIDGNDMDVYIPRDQFVKACQNNGNGNVFRAVVRPEDWDAAP